MKPRSDRSERRWFQAIGGGLLPLVPGVGAGILALHTVFSGRRQRLAPFILVWIGYWAPIATLAIVIREPRLLATTSLQAALGIAAGWLLSGRARVIGRAMTIGLGILFAGLLFAQLSSPHLWNTWATDDTVAQALTSLARGSQLVSGVRDRSWHVPSGATNVSVSLDVRLAQGTVAGAWNLHDGVQLTRLNGRYGPFERLVFPAGGDPYAERRADTGHPVAGSTFRVVGWLRSGTEVPVAACRGLWIQVWGPGGASHCKSVQVNATWTKVDFQWSPPSTAPGRTIHVVVNNFNGYTIDVRDVSLWRKGDAGWVRIQPLLPAAVGLTLLGPSQISGGRTFGFVPDGAWHTFTVSSPIRVAAPNDVLTVMIGVPDGADVRLRRTRLSTDAGAGRPVMRLRRQSAWTGQPNLLAHSLVASTLLAVGFTSTPLWSWLAAAIGMGDLWFAGGRSALVVAILALSALVLTRRQLRRLASLLVLGALTIVVMLVVVSSFVPHSPLDRLAPVNVGQETPRTEIWKTAFQAWREHPWGGLSATRTDFSQYWKSQHPSASEVIRHAHNLWLQYASAYGVAGLLSIVWLTVAFLVLAWARGRWPAVIPVLAILALNLFDFTLFYSGVLFPMILAVNVLPGRDRDDANGDSGKAPA